MEPLQAPGGRWQRRASFFARKAILLALSTVLFGYVYSKFSPMAYASSHPAGFGLGFLHGALMPLSLPSLVVGQNVSIYDDNNLGRLYKIGYICGVNVCGMLFLGPLFWRPRPAKSTNSGKSR